MSRLRLSAVVCARDAGGRRTDIASNKTSWGDSLSSLGEACGFDALKRERRPAIMHDWDGRETLEGGAISGRAGVIGLGTCKPPQRRVESGIRRVRRRVCVCVCVRLCVCVDSGGGLSPWTADEWTTRAQPVPSSVCRALH